MASRRILRAGGLVAWRFTISPPAAQPLFSTASAAWKVSPALAPGLIASLNTPARLCAFSTGQQRLLALSSPRRPSIRIGSRETTLRPISRSCSNAAGGGRELIRQDRHDYDPGR